MHAGPEPQLPLPVDPAGRSRDLQRAINDDDGVEASFRPGLVDGIALYRKMMTLRLVSARMVALQRSETVAFHASCIGEEAAIVGATLAARTNDWVFPGVREWGAALVRGLPIATYMHHAFGSASDPARGHSAPDHPPARQQRVAPASGIPGAHVPQAVGMAWAAKIKKDDVATIAIFGESASCAGDFHNALNFAGVFKPACVLVCRESRESRESIAAKAVAYGIASARVDGSDALAVLGVVRAALARAAAGHGATLVVTVTEPLAPVLAADVWHRGGPELLALGDRDPLARLRRVLEREKLIDAAAHDALASELRSTIDAAVAQAEAAPAPAASTIFDDVFAEVPAHLRAQKESLQ